MSIQAQVEKVQKEGKSRPCNGELYSFPHESMEAVCPEGMLGKGEIRCGAKWISGIVLDPFAGTGTTAVEAIRNRRRAVLIDVSDAYGEIIRKRVNEVQVRME